VTLPSDESKSASPETSGVLVENPCLNSSNSIFKGLVDNSRNEFSSTYVRSDINKGNSHIVFWEKIVNDMRTLELNLNKFVTSNIKNYQLLTCFYNFRNVMIAQLNDDTPMGISRLLPSQINGEVAIQSMPLVPSSPARSISSDSQYSDFNELVDDVSECDSELSTVGSFDYGNKRLNEFLTDREVQSYELSNNSLDDYRNLQISSIVNGNDNYSSHSDEEGSLAFLDFDF
jgi:hypothetical protein